MSKKKSVGLLLLFFSLLFAFSAHAYPVKLPFTLPAEVSGVAYDKYMMFQTGVSVYHAVYASEARDFRIFTDSTVRCE